MKYLLKRKFFTLLGKEFTIFDDKNNIVAYAKQKAFKLKEEILVYTDSTKEQVLVSIKARNVWDFGATYDIRDENNELLGAFRRMGVRSMFRDEWRILTPGDNEIGVIQEESSILALVRRLLTNLVPQKFDLRIGESDVGGFQQQFNLFRYQLEIEIDETFLDKRMAFAAAILLGAIEGRQG
ncbi:hypothetical protein IT418_03085 [bacterium]|nr:hypothetical protein [bacterium]